MDGSITAIASRGKGAYRYSRDGHTWQSGPDFTQLRAGTYTIYVQDSLQHLGKATVQLREPAALTISGQHAAASCNGNAQISVQATGGTPPYVYSRDNGRTWQQANSFTQLLPGDYSILVKDQHGCTTGTRMHLAAPDPLEIATVIRNATCYESSNGSISIKAGGGGLPYQYSINGLTWQDDAVFTHLPRGIYTVFVKDHNGCILEKKAEITAPPPLTMQTQNQDASCYGYTNAAITIQAAGGTQPYRYSNNGGLSWQGTPDFQGISAGAYKVAVADRKGCRIYDTVTLHAPAYFHIISATGVFNGGPECGIAVIAEGGTPDYKYRINTRQQWQSTPVFDSLVPDTYSLYAQDEHGCSSGLRLTVATSDVVQLSVTSWGASCYQGTNGRIIIKPEGGTGPYRYSADSGVTWQSANGFYRPAGTYQILVEDRYGHRAHSQVAVGEPPLLTANAQVSHVTCYNANNGNIIPLPAGGSPAYKYSLDNGATWQAKPAFTGLPGGHYTLLVQDKGNCKASTTIDLHEPTALHITAKASHVSCYGGNDGSINITTEGGTPPYRYSNDRGLTWQDASSYTQLKHGSYGIYVRDDNGCMDSADITIQEPAALALRPAVQHIGCYGAGNGKITLAASGGTLPYLYSMDNGSFRTTPVFDTLAPGMYMVAVQDANGCISSGPATITQPHPLALKFVSAANGCSYIGGQLSVKASGGTLPYTYTLNNTALSNASGEFSGLTAGSFTALVTDVNGCADTIAPVNIHVSPELTMVLDDKQDMQCDGIHPGAVRFHAAGGTLPYRYSLNEKPVPDGNIRTLDKGEYNAIVQDQYGCVAAQAFTIKLLDEDCELTMPTGFSPNGDGQNDIFRPALYGNIRNYQLQVFNVWGNLVFAQNDP
ncbi:MAG TPA: gliding motility-associated C-terminal domain-containing protein, partial [Chitinophaga sp.]|uniref:T9SS type B sorting domain-containing protein n=1 Tax=Chitinophaga sp. TaxID=1869181 RepID=UPI002DBAC20C